MKLIKYFKKTSLDDKIFDITIFIILTLSALVIIYPLYFIIIASFSDPTQVNSGNVWLWIKGFTLDGYNKVFHDPNIWRGYWNSLVYTVLGTIISVVLTLTAGYALSRKDLVGSKYLMLIFVFTMFFNGGLIPKYILVNQLGWMNKIWAMIIPDAVSVFNIIIARTFFSSTIPSALLESAKVEGCQDLTFFRKIVLPLSKPVIAIMVLFYAIGSWNSWFNGMLYLQDQSKYTLNLILRSILIEVDVSSSQMNMAALDNLLAQQKVAQLVKYVVIIVSSVPVLLIYPFIQKHFIKGVMIGSIKE
jgi:putative aldouronate transport system permease protein